MIAAIVVLETYSKIQNQRTLQGPDEMPRRLLLNSVLKTIEQGKASDEESKYQEEEVDRLVRLLDVPSEPTEPVPRKERVLRKKQSNLSIMFSSKVDSLAPDLTSFPFRVPPSRTPSPKSDIMTDKITRPACCTFCSKEFTSVKKLLRCSRCKMHVCRACIPRVSNSFSSIYRVAPRRVCRRCSTKYKHPLKSVQKRINARGTIGISRKRSWGRGVDILSTLQRWRTFAWWDWYGAAKQSVRYINA